MEGRVEGRSSFLRVNVLLVLLDDLFDAWVWWDSSCVLK